MHVLVEVEMSYMYVHVHQTDLHLYMYICTCVYMLSSLPIYRSNGNRTCTWHLIIDGLLYMTTQGMQHNRKAIKAEVINAASGGIKPIYNTSRQLSYKITFNIYTALHIHVYIYIYYLAILPSNV